MMNLLDTLSPFTKTAIAALCLCFCFSCTTLAQYQNVLIDENSTGGYGPCEPSIAVSPADPKKVVAGSILDRVYHSHDSGLTWQKDTLKSTYGVYGDPVLIADYQGNFYYFHLSNPYGEISWSGHKLDRIVCQTSTDSGLSWTDGGFAGFHHPKDQDKEWAIADPTDHTIYMSWTQFDAYSSKAPEDKSNILFAKSTDQGATWSESMIINEKAGDCLDGDQTTEGAVPAVGPNGEVYVAWSFDDRIYFDRSTDKGATWMDEDVVVAKQSKGWDFEIPGIGRANGLPITACDISEGPNRGAIYVNWSDQSNGEDDTDIWVAKSTDGGISWGDPVRVNDDPPGKHQFFTWMAVDPMTGYIYIVFYDRRNYEDAQTDVYLAWSKDGGATFTNELISESPFKPNPDQFFGDYNNISVYNGIVRPIWTRQEGDTLSVWTAIIDK